LHHAAFGFVNAIEAREPPRKQQQYDECDTACTTGATTATTATTATAKNTAKTLLPVPYYLVQLSRLVPVTFPGVFAISIFVPRHNVIHSLAAGADRLTAFDAS